MRIPGRRIALSLVAVFSTTSLIAVALAQGSSSREHRLQLPISVAEAQSRLHERSTGIDANRDGFITVQEFAAQREAKRAERLQRRMASVDTNQDGRVSVTEFEAAHLARIESADANRDGQVTREEMRAMRMQRRADRAQRHADSARGPNA